MSRYFLFLFAIAALSHGAGGNALAQNEKQRVNSRARATQGTPEAEFEKGNAAFDRKEWAEAVTHYDAVLRSKPDHVPALVNRGRVALATGRLKEASADFLKVTELNPELPAGRTWLSAALLDQGKHTEAIAEAGKAIRLDPKQGYAWYIRGTGQIHKGELNKAIEDLDEAAKLVPNDPVVYNNRGIAWQKLGDEGKAKADFARRDQLMPKKDALTAKQNAKLRMDQALARFDQIDFQVKSFQNGRPVPTTRTGPQGIPQRVVRPVPPELLQLREEAWKAYLDACRVHNETP